MQINLSVKDGKVYVDPYYAKCHLDEEIMWMAEGESAWTITFRNGKTPTDAIVIHGSGSTADHKHHAKKRGHYPYAVSLEGQSKSKGPLHGKRAIFVDVACPEIIIE